MWFEQLGLVSGQRHLLNDSKTPSGRIHVGALRGVLLHDALLRLLGNMGADGEFVYGIDDFDPIDALPADAPAELQAQMGMPLFAVQYPGSSSNVAEYYAQEFLQVCAELGVNFSLYRTSEMYRSGKFNAAIATILQHAPQVRAIYRSVSGSHKPADWYPFQVICQHCGQLGATKVHGFDGKVVTYTCQPRAVAWAKGCGITDTISPYDGNGKLPWKLEWVAKWLTFGVTLEGSGKDHCTKGGSRDVADRCIREIFQQQPPLNLAYEFFLVGGAKMSSSKGVGYSARAMADFLPANILRYLMLRTQPKHVVNFATDLAYISRLYNEYDQLAQQYSNATITAANKQLFEICQPQLPVASTFQPNFQLLTALAQLPHLDTAQTIIQRQDTPLSAADIAVLHQRIVSAKYWLQHFADPADVISIQQQLPPAVAALSLPQRIYLQLLADIIPANTINNEQQYQQLLFDTARLVPLAASDAFAAIYQALLAATRGPRAGSLLHYLDAGFVQQRLQATALTLAEVKQFIAGKITDIATLQLELTKFADKSPIVAIGTALIDDDCTELLITQANGVVQVQYTSRLPANITLTNSAVVVQQGDSVLTPLRMRLGETSRAQGVPSNKHIN